MRDHKADDIKLRSSAAPVAVQGTCLLAHGCPCSVYLKGVPCTGKGVPCTRVCPVQGCVLYKGVSCTGKGVPCTGKGEPCTGKPGTEMPAEQVQVQLSDIEIPPVPVWVTRGLERCGEGVSWDVWCGGFLMLRVAFSDCVLRMGLSKISSERK